MKKLILRLKWWDLLWILPLRHLDHKALVIRIESEISKIPSTWNHIAIKIILKFIHAVYIDFGNSPVLKKPFLVIHPMLAEKGDSIIRMYRPLFDWQIHLHHFLHPGCHLV